MDKKILRCAEIFEGLREDQVKRVASCARTETFRYGDRIHREGDRADCLHLVTRGRVALRFDLPGRASTDQSTLSRVRECESFGWSALIPDSRYRLSAYCDAPTCEVIRINGPDLLERFQDDPEMGLRVMNNLAAVVGTRLHRLQESALESRASTVKITVHMSTCGIAAGARQTMKILMEEIHSANRLDIDVRTGSCLGKCAGEPQITVEVEGEDPVVYQKVDADRMRRIFQGHILGGETQADLAMPAA